MEDKYCWFFKNAEEHKYTADEVEECIKEALEQLNNYQYDNIIKYDEKGKYFDIYVAECDWYQSCLCAENVIEMVQEQAYTDIEEYSEGYLENIPDYHKEWLDEKLDEIWNEFLTRTKTTSPYYSISKEKLYKIYISGEFGNYEIIEKLTEE